MNKLSNRQLIKAFLGARLCAFLFYISILLCGAVTFFLYRIILEPFLYTAVLITVLGLVLLIIDYFIFARKVHAAEDQVDELLQAQEMKLRAASANDRQDLIDYYTTWVHQIKTPISVMHLLLHDDTKENQALSAELFRIEQYVDMVLQYIRLEEDGSDLVVRAYALDDIIRKAIRKYASQFIYRKISLNFTPTNLQVITDEKWLNLILEQLLSNAIKYTQTGSITIGLDAENRLYIQDTGIGISAEDLPRIFERGYTGENGRLSHKSSGLGLYLCKKAADKLSITIHTKSAPGEGSVFSLCFPE